VQKKAGNRETDKSIKKIRKLENERKLDKIQTLKDFGGTLQKLIQKRLYY